MWVWGKCSLGPSWQVAAGGCGITALGRAKQGLQCKRVRLQQAAAIWWVQLQQLHASAASTWQTFASSGTQPSAQPVAYVVTTL